MRRRAARSNWRRNRRMFRRFSVWWLLQFVAVAALGTGAFAQNTPAKPVRANTNPQFNIERPNIARPSVILITIDTLRADHVGCYGAQTVKTPTLDALAHDGVVFERAISSGSADLAFTCGDPDRNLPFSERRAGFHRSATRSTISIGSPGLSTGRLHHGSRGQRLCSRPKLGLGTRFRLLR